MDTKNHYPPQRIALAGTFAAMAAAFVGPTVNRILQLQQGEQWPQWTVWFLVIGGILFIAALLILVPHQWWSNIRNLKWSITRWIHRTCLWKRYGPRYTIEKPIIGTLKTGADFNYTADVAVVIRNMDKYPLEVNIDSTQVHLKQNIEWHKLSALLENRTGSGTIMLEPYGQKKYQVRLSAIHIGREPPFLTDSANWGVQGVSVTLRGERFELHKGIYVKYIPQKSIGTY